MKSKARLTLPLLAMLLLMLPSMAFGFGKQAPVVPIFEGLTLNEGTGTYTARFGYDNHNDFVVKIPAGRYNKIGIWPKEAGQVTEFQPGRVYNAFEIEINYILPLTWSLRGPDRKRRTAIAPPAFIVHDISPILESGGVIDEFDNEKGMFIARFGYKNPNYFSIKIPVGENNKISGGPIDQGQTTLFEPGRQHAAFSVDLLPAQTKVWTLTGRTSTATAPEKGPDDESIDPVGGDIPDPNETENVVVDPAVENVLARFNELDSSEQKLIMEAYFLQADKNPDGTLSLVWVDLECQFSSMANKEQAYQILKGALNYTDQDSISNGMQLKLTMRLPPDVAIKMQNDDSLALINPVLVQGDNRLMEIVQLRPRPLLNSGIVSSQADSTQGSNRARRGWGVSGKGVKLGILSDSYNALGGAAAGVASGELPANVSVLKDISGIDEGRAMAEIINDVAPGIEQLLFHTAFLSEGDFAMGIKALADEGSNIIVDDVTYPTAPWFFDGPVSRAVNEVVDRGVIYVTSAGNFSDHAVEGVFTPAGAPPAGLPFPTSLELHAIDGASDVLQTVGLDSGLHIMALQWENDFVTEGAGGSVDDLDIYILNQDGTIRAGSKKNNIGNDPWEFFAFEVKKPSDVANIVIVRKAGSTANLKFKYVFFRTAGVEFLKNGSADQLNASTIIAHAQNPKAITVAAAPYFDHSRLEAFSSMGTGPKPDFTAPDGGNNSFFGFDYEGDLIPNFFGTSAAAPHLAGVLALLSEGYDSLSLEPVTLAKARQTLETTAIDIGDPGFDNMSGHGFIRADRALQTLGNPLPLIEQLDLLDRNESDPTFNLGINGDFFVAGQSLVRIGNDTLVPGSVTDTRINIEVDTSIGSSPIQVINPAISNSNGDGGASDIFTATDEFYTIDVRVADAVKTYLQGIPAFETSYTVTPTVLAEGNTLSAEDTLLIAALLADPAAFSSQASDTSSIGLYQVDFEPGELDTLEKIGFTSRPGLLIVEPLEVFLTANDLSVSEGDAIADQLEYSLDVDLTGIDIVDKQDLLDAILAAYEGSLADALVVANFARAIVNNPDAQIDPGLLSYANMLISGTALEEGKMQGENGEYTVIAESDNLVALLEDPNAVTAATNFARAIVNGEHLFDPNQEVAIDFDHDGNPNTNLARAIVNLARAIVNGGEVGDGEGLLNLARAIVNEEPLAEPLMLNLARAIVNESQNPNSGAISNFARAIVNEGLVEEPGSLLNLARAIVNENDPAPEAFSNFARAIVNLARAIVNRGGRAIVNFSGRAIVNGKAFGQENPFYALISVADTARLNEGGEVNEVEFHSIPLITGQGPGQHLILPGSVVLTNQAGVVMANAHEEISGPISIPFGNFIFTTRTGTLTVEEVPSGAGIQSFVWDDLNGNNLQDAGEPGLPGVTVQLVTANLKKVLRSITTGESGIAFFQNLEQYDGVKVRLRYLPLEGYGRSKRDAGDDPLIDADANSDGITQPFFVEPNELVTKWDAGYIAIPATPENAVEVGLREESGDLPDFEGAFRVFPNPTLRDVNIEIPQGVNGLGDIRVLDASGRTLQFSKHVFTPGSLLSLDLTTERKGVYFIQITWGRNTKLFKVLKN